MAVAGRVAIVPKGDYDKSVTYKRLDCVKYYNVMYVAKKDVPIGIELTNDEYWMKGVEGGGGADIDDSQVSTSTTYSSSKITNLINELNTEVDTKLESKLDKTDGDISETVVGVADVPETRTIPTVGDKFKAILGKIIKYFQDLKTVAFTGSYNDLSDKPTMPSVGNGTVTIKQAGTSKGTFTMNQLGDTTIELTDNDTKYTLPSATSSTLGGVKITDSSAVTDSTGLALAATEKNASISGTIANQISTLNSNLSLKNTVEIISKTASADCTLTATERKVIQVTWDKPDNAVLVGLWINSNNSNATVALRNIGASAANIKVSNDTTSGINVTIQLVLNYIAVT